MMLDRILLLVIGSTLMFFSGVANGHPPGPDDSEHGHGKSPATSPFQPAVILPNVDGPTPWSTKPVLNDLSRFQIAVVTDRTGGHRPGIWMKGVRRLNMLRPEFVVSVGDLIEGYTEDRRQVENEWKEFLGFIDKLDMKFFFVAGNHDLTNSMMHEVWREHFGPEWYSFDYKDVHILCLCTEDPESCLGEEQLQWIEQDLATSRDARWTLIFLHKPLWAYADRERRAGNPDKTGWTRVESALGDRPRTVFAGHHHAYVQFDRGGMKYYQLATMGGGSQLRGSSYGEFDHIVWLTMEPTGPHVTNLMLDGIQPAEIVTEQSIARFRNFLAQSQLEVAPILLEDEAGFHSGRIDLRFTNRFDKPVEVRGRLDGIPLRGLTLEPGTIQLRAEPGETTELALTLDFVNKMAYSQLAGTVFTAKLQSDESRSLTAERTVPVVIERRHTVPQIAAPTVDGNLDDWHDLRYRTTSESLVLGATEFWNGPGDASFEFDVAGDDDHIYLAARVTDDRLYSGDRFDVLVDGRPITKRVGDKRLRDGCYRIRVGAPQARSETTQADAPLQQSLLAARQDRAIPDKLVARAVATEAGYDVELAIPTSLLKQQGGSWHSFQLTALVRDVDEQGQDPCRVLWRGTVDVDRRNSGYGHFVRSVSE